MFMYMVKCIINRYASDVLRVYVYYKEECLYDNKEVYQE